MQVISDNLMYSATCFYASQGSGESGGGGSSGGLSGTFPSEPITADSENCFLLGAGTESFLAYKGDVAFLGDNENSWKALDKDEQTETMETKLWIKFKEPVAIKTFSANIGNNMWYLYATNDEELFKDTIANNRIVYNDSVALIEGGEHTQYKTVDYPVNAKGVAYKYYMFDGNRSNAFVKEIALKTE